jgi:hypothetical protein
MSMLFPFASELREELEARGEARGKVRGHAESLQFILMIREVELSEAQRARIEACDDLDLLKEWTARAVSATSAAEVFGPETE